MNLLQETVKAITTPMPASLAKYCDFIANRIKTALQAEVDRDMILADVGRIEWDLNEDDSYLSPTKTIEVEDQNGSRYRITVEAL